MVHHTHGMVFKFFRYRETSVIAKIFTARFGLQTYIINGVRSSRKGGGKMALLQPLTLLDLVVYKKANTEIQRISEIRCLHPFESVPYEVRKSTISLFLAEMLYKCVREEGPSEGLFGFLEQSMLIFDHLEDHFQNFHLQFLMRLSRFLGYGLDASPGFRTAFTGEELRVVERLLQEPYGSGIVMGRTLRRTVLDHIIEFYKLHNEGLGDIRSLAVLKEIF